ncbi:unnamed protein product [Urochloa humidicola]
MPPSSTAPLAAAAPARTVRIFVDGPGRRVLLAEASADAAAFFSSLFAEPLRAAAKEMLLDLEDPASADTTCFGNAFDTLLPRVGDAASTSFRAPPPASAPPKGMGIMARRIFCCAHLGCTCSDAVSREAGSACPCASPSCGVGGRGRRDTELHFLEACFYRRPGGSAAVAGRGGGRGGDTFYRCPARDERRGVTCPLCGGRTTVAVKCANEVPARPEGRRDGGEDGDPTTTSHAIMENLSVRPVAAGLSGAVLLAALGVAADPADVREEIVSFGAEEVKLNGLRACSWQR